MNHNRLQVFTGNANPALAHEICDNLGIQVGRATDSTYATGQPGIGFFLQGASGANRDYGFASFTARDQP